MRNVIASRTSRGLARVRDAMTTALAVLGAMVALWLLASWAFGLSVVVVLTGSMTPDIPAGSAAVVQRVAAADLTVGDVVTVPRAGYAIPVTHRIESIADAGGDARILILRGDANPVSDPDPYVLTEADRVITSMPAIGHAVRWIGTGPGTLAIVLTAALAVTAILWPRRADDAEGSAAAGDDAPEPAPDDGGEPGDVLSDLFHDADSERTRT